MARGNEPPPDFTTITMRKYLLSPTGVALAFVLVICAPGSRARAGDPFDLDFGSVLPKDLNDLLQWTDSPAAPTPVRPDRIRLFRIMPGFLAEPIGLQDDDPTVAPDGSPLKTDDGPNWVQLAIGNDNPFFDVHLPGDPGGIGYTRVQTQLQVLDLPSTSCTLGFQAVTPTGAQQGGLEDGATVVSPAFGLFHSLDDGTVFQGFVSKDLHVSSPANFTDTLSHGSQFARSVQYGMAVQRSVLPDSSNVYFFLEALGRYRYDLPQPAPGTAANSAATLDVLPGMHMKLSDGWWLSGGVILPVNSTQPINGRLWQFTCSFQF
jgi:hypothetical protein